MRVLANTPSGKLILNPSNVLALVNGSPHGAAALVARGRDLVVSTGYTCHNDMMAAAGLEHVDFDLEVLNFEEATFRGGMNSTSISFDIWNVGDRFEVDEYVDALRATYDFLSSHRKLAGGPPLGILIYDDDYVQTHSFDAAGLVAIRPSPSPM
jgi:hypothetical protein